MAALGTYQPCASRKHLNFALKCATMPGVHAAARVTMYPLVSMQLHIMSVVACSCCSYLFEGYVTFGGNGQTGQVCVCVCVRVCVCADTHTCILHIIHTYMYRCVTLHM